MALDPGLDNLKPPPPPTTVAGLMTELLGTLDSAAGLYQGAVRYWFMWRLPQIVSAIRGAPPLRFHMCCASIADLHSQFVRVFLLPDLLVVGQCGPLLDFELLQYSHPLEHNWPCIDGRPPSGLHVISGKMDRPLGDGIVSFLHECIRPLAPTGQVAFAPLTTLLAGPEPVHLSPEATRAEIERASHIAKSDGLPTGKTLRDCMDEARRVLRSSEQRDSIPVSELMGDVPKGSFGLDTHDVENRAGRVVPKGAMTSRPDPVWSPGDILAYEFLLATQMGSMFVVAGDWTSLLPPTAYSLNLRIPYIEGIHPVTLATAVGDDPEAFVDFRKTITRGLKEAFESRGSEAFGRELARIQSEIIDGGIDRLDRKWRELCRQRFIRVGGYTARTVSITVGLYFAFNPAALAGMFGSMAVSAFEEWGRRVAEQAQLKGEPMYFIWQLGP